MARKEAVGRGDWEDVVNIAACIIGHAAEHGAWTGAFQGLDRTWFACHDPNTLKIAYMGSNDDGPSVIGITDEVPTDALKGPHATAKVREVVLATERAGSTGYVAEFAMAMNLLPQNWKLMPGDPDGGAVQHPPPEGWETFLDLASRLDRTLVPALRTYESCQGYRSKLSNPRFREATALYPFFSATLIGGPWSFDHGGDIDEVVLHVLASACMLPREKGSGQRRLLKRILESLKGLEVGRDVIPCCTDLLRASASPERIPGSAAEWEACADIFRMREIIERETGLCLPHLTDVKGGRYGDLARRLAPLGESGGHFERASRIVNALMAPVRQFADLVIVPMAVRGGAVPLVTTETVGDDVFAPTLIQAGLLKRPGLSEKQSAGFLGLAYGIMAGDKTLGGLLDLSGDFHARYATIAAAMGHAVSGSGLTWKSVLPPDLDLGNGFTARCLLTPEELLAEGDPATGLNHCVAGYYPRCAGGDLAIVAIRKDDAPHSTLSLLHPAEGRPDWQAMEHRGHSNRPPGDGWEGREAKVLAAAEAYCEGGFRNSSGKPTQPYDPFRPRAVKGLASAFLPLLPRDMRDGTGQKVLDAVKREIPRILAVQDTTELSRP